MTLGPPRVDDAPAAATLARIGPREYGFVEDLGGFRKIRHSYRMVIDLDSEPEEPRWPERIEVRPFGSGNERTFHETHMETFADHCEPVEMSFEQRSRYALQPPVFEPASWLLALDGPEPAGFAIPHAHRTNKRLGWVGELGVRRPWRRRGLARALLLQAFRAFRARGLAQGGLEVDAENLTGAHSLYESVGMRVAHRFDIYEKTLA